MLNLVLSSLCQSGGLLDQVEIKQARQGVMAKNSDRRVDGDDDDIQHGSVYSVSGPVVVAENMLGCQMYELVMMITWQETDRAIG